MHYYTRHLMHFHDTSQRSAREIIPLVQSLTQLQSVVDVGCGLGSWLSVFREQGVEDVWGVDGDWVDREMLQIPSDRFLSRDLSKPLHISKTFDLVVSLEVAEHIPQESAETFVDSLTALGPLILFSAAIPFQGGTNHVNEQWPEYWVNLFQKRSYQAVDCIRSRIWNNNNVAWWYAQNTFIFIDRTRLKDYPLIVHTLAGNLAMVHPKCYANKVNAYMTSSDPRQMSLKRMVKDFPVAIMSSLKRKINKRIGT